MDRDVALSLVDILGDIKTELEYVVDKLDTIATNTTPADGGDSEPSAGGDSEPAAGT